jgi:hypothetical protein
MGKPVKKIKGQISGKHYAWLVSVAEKRRCAVSDVLRELVAWMCSEPERVLPPPLVESAKKSAGAHTALNFNASERLLGRWEHFKRVNNVGSDAQAIRLVVGYRYAMVSRPKAETVSGKPTQQQSLF